MVKQLLWISLFVLFFSCQKGNNTTNPPNSSNSPSNEVDSMHYVLKYEDMNKIPIKSTYIFTYEDLNGSRVVSKIKRIDTLFGPSFRTANYVDKNYSYDNQGRLIGVVSKSRRIDLLPGAVMTGAGQVENYSMSYDYAVPDQWNYPMAINVEVYTDSSATTILYHEKFTTDAVSFDHYNGPNHVLYYREISGDTAAFYDNDQAFWVGSGAALSDDYSLSMFVFSDNGFVKDFYIDNEPSHPLYGGVENQRRVHITYDSAYAKLIGLFTGHSSFAKYGFSSERLLDKYFDFSNQDLFRGVINELKNLSLSSTDSTLVFNDKGVLLEVIDKMNTTGTVTVDAEGRVAKVVKRIAETRARQPVGNSITTQTFDFFYKK